MHIDHNGATNKCMMLAGYNDTDAKTATTYLVTPGFKGNEHPKECLNFWYNIGVSFLLGSHLNSFPTIIHYFGGNAY